MKNLLFTLLCYVSFVGGSFASEPIDNLKQSSKLIINDLNITIDVTESTCDMDDGEISFSITGGTPPYTITPSNLTNLAAGTYDYTITDSGSCVVDTTVVVNEDNDLSTFVDVLDEISCSGNESAEAIVNVAGGSGEYLVMIETNPPISEVSPGVFSTTITGGGSYGITITDIADNCMLVDNFAVGQPSPIVIEAEITEIDSCSGRILMLDFTASGGTPPYESEVNPDNLGVEIIVTDSEDCSESLYVPNPEIEDALMISQILVFPPDPGDDNGSIDITVEGGDPPYFYRWEDDAGNELSTDEDIDDLEAGTYVVYVSDSKSCNILSGDIILDDTSSTDDKDTETYSIYPNPIEQDFFFLEGPLNPGTRIQLYNIDGNMIRTIAHVVENQRINMVDYPEGLYFINVIRADGKSKVLQVVVH